MLMTRYALLAGALLIASFTVYGYTVGIAADNDAAGTLSDMPRAVQPAIRVRVVRAKQDSVVRSARATGIVAPFRVSSVAAEVAGRVLERHVEPGDAVTAGSPIISLDPSHHAIALEQARALLRARNVDVEEMRNELQRGDELLEKNVISNREHDALRFALDRAEAAHALAAVAIDRAQQTLDDTVVRAPFDGTVEAVARHVGDYLTPGHVVATVIDFSRGRIRVGVTAGEAKVFSAGATASVVLDALGGVERPGVIRSVGRIADNATGTYPLEVWLENPGDALRAGMVARVRLTSNARSSAIYVPRAALVKRSSEVVVFVIEEDEGVPKAHARAVRTGQYINNRVEIVDGIRAGERIVVEGHFSLADGALVRVETSAEDGASWNG